MTELDKIYGLFIMFWVALVSPGPNLAMILRASAEHSRTDGFMVTLGLTSGVFIQGALGALGLCWLFDVYPAALKVIQITGAIYLTYLGFRGLMTKKAPQTEKTEYTYQKKSLAISFQLGLWTQLLNPFATISILSLFGIFYSHFAWVRSLYVAIFVVSYLVWYGALSLILTNVHLQKKLFAQRHWIERITGIALIYFAIKMVRASV
ncbi:MAG: LysE family translocator [Alphaproteobacteria bacterium]